MKHFKELGSKSICHVTKNKFEDHLNSWIISEKKKPNTAYILKGDLNFKYREHWKRIVC